MSMLLLYNVHTLYSKHSQNKPMRSVSSSLNLSKIYDLFQLLLILVVSLQLSSAQPLDTDKK